MAPANAPSELSKVPSRITVYNKELDRYFQVVREGSDIYQTEYQLDEQGSKLFTAAEYLKRALQNGSNFEATYIDFGEALAHLGQVEESAKVLEQGVAAWPFSADIQKALVLRYVTLKQSLKADEALKRYVALFPEDTFMRGIQARVEARNP
jgi:tetratricopeptide (TPR) repeat protein